MLQAIGSLPKPSHCALPSCGIISNLRSSATELCRLRDRSLPRQQILDSELRNFTCFSLPTSMIACVSSSYNESAHTLRLWGTVQVLYWRKQSEEGSVTHRQTVSAVSLAAPFIPAARPKLQLQRHAWTIGSSASWSSIHIERWYKLHRRALTAA